MKTVSKKSIFRLSVAMLSIVMALIFTGCFDETTDGSNEILKISSEDFYASITSNEISSEGEETSSEQISNESTSEELSSEDSSSEDSSSEESSSEEPSSKESSSEEPSSEEPSSKESSSEEPTSEEPSSEESSSEEPSSEELSSEESSSEELSEEAKKINQEIIQKFPDLDFAYALYDIETKQTVVKYNTQKLFPMGDTIKAAYFFWIYESGIYETDKERHITITEEDCESNLEDLGYVHKLEYLIKASFVYDDDVRFRAVLRTYGYTQFIDFMLSRDINIKVEKDNTFFTTADDHMKLWILIEEYIKKYPTSAFSEHLFVTEQYSLYYPVHSISGNEKESGTLSECQIYKKEYIAILITSDGIAIEENEPINNKPIKFIREQLNAFWETYYA